MAVLVPNQPSRLLFLVAMLCICGMSAVVFGQDTDLRARESVLVDEFGRLGDCEFSSRIDVFFAELSENPDHHGYIINYKSVDELPGDRGNFIRERTITNHIAFRNFEASRITMVNGGYRKEMSTQLWRVPRGAKPPVPSDTLAAPRIPDKTTFLYAKRHMYSDYEEDILHEFVLQSVKDQEEADRISLEAESKADAEAQSKADAEDEEKTEAELKVEAAPEHGTPTSDESDDAAADVDERTPEEKEEARFSWANVGIARLLSERKIGTGVIIFYADDQRYDIGKLQAFIEQGRFLLANNGPIKESRLSIVFGGYRNEPQVEFWVVPAKGKNPTATPDERPVEQPDATQH